MNWAKKKVEKEKENWSFPVATFHSTIISVKRDHLDTKRVQIKVFAQVYICCKSVLFCFLSILTLTTYLEQSEEVSERFRSIFIT
jgi:hypothetical protein